MGDQVGLAVGGTLYHVPQHEFVRVREGAGSKVQRSELFAALCRINILYMIARCGSGHIGSSFSSIDIMAWLHLNELRGMDSADPDHLPSDIFFSSKGHDAPALYSSLIGLGKLDYDLIHQLRRVDGLPGHPDVATPHIVTNTGSLGMGISKAKGMIFANRLQGVEARVFVLTGDGELQEGQFWESLISAKNFNMDELTVIIDHNKLQSDTLVSKVSDLGDLEAKLKAFGWHVSRCDGNDLNALSSALEQGKSVVGVPKIIIADTVKGKGVAFMEHTSIDSDVELYKFHSGAPTEHAYRIAAQELIDSANQKLTAVGLDKLLLESVTRSSAVSSSENQERLVGAYSDALLSQARKNSSIVALDADLVLDTGLIPFQKEFPERFVECGIAEQDMVSQAGGMAIKGLLPIVHSFACFLSTRPNEQMYNNATEAKKIIYVGSLAGIIPGGPGHSHQAVRDISTIAAIPNMTVMEPGCEAEVSLLLDWAINKNEKSSYIRLTSIPCRKTFDLPKEYSPRLGEGVTLVEGDDVVIFAYGPVMLAAAIEAAVMVKAESNLLVKVVNLPWLNAIDATWFENTVGASKAIISIDNHYCIGGQGDRIATAMAESRSISAILTKIGLNEVPVSGTNDEVLERHSLNSQAIKSRILSAVLTND